MEDWVRCLLIRLSIYAVTGLGLITYYVIKPDWLKRYKLVGHVTELIIYPVASCRGISVREAFCGKGGLEKGAYRDREFMIVAIGPDKIYKQFNHQQLSDIHPICDGRNLQLSAPGMTNINFPVVSQTSVRFSLNWTVKNKKDNEVQTFNTSVGNKTFVNGCGQMEEGVDCGGKDVSKWLCKYLDMDSLRLYRRNDVTSWSSRISFDKTSFEEECDRELELDPKEETLTMPKAPAVEKLRAKNVTPLSVQKAGTKLHDQAGGKLGNKHDQMATFTQRMSQLKVAVEKSNKKIASVAKSHKNKTKNNVVADDDDSEFCFGSRRVVGRSSSSSSRGIFGGNTPCLRNGLVRRRGGSIRQKGMGHIYRQGGGGGKQGKQGKGVRTPDKATPNLSPSTSSTALAAGKGGKKPTSGLDKQKSAGASKAKGLVTKKPPTGKGKRQLNRRNSYDTITDSDDASVMQREKIRDDFDDSWTKEIGQNSLSMPVSSPEQSATVGGKGAGNRAAMEEQDRQERIEYQQLLEDYYNQQMDEDDSISESFDEMEPDVSTTSDKSPRLGVVTMYTVQSIEAINQTFEPYPKLDSHDFRANIVISGSEEQSELGWEKIRIGKVKFAVHGADRRCLRPEYSHADGTYRGEPEPMESMYGKVLIPGSCPSPLVGLKLTVNAEGKIRLGDPVYAIEADSPFM